jgi:Phosphotransferase enzyme family
VPPGDETADGTARAALDAFCAAYSLRIIEQLPVAAGGSVFLARVVDGGGAELFLKRRTRLRGTAEIPLLQAWQPLGVVPANLRVYDEDTFSTEWVGGATLDRAPGEPALLLRRCGEVLRALHSSHPAVPLMPINERASPEWVARDMGNFLLPELRPIAEDAARQLVRASAHEAVTLHGDAVPGNVLVDGARVLFIDPIGFSGPAGWDVAQLALGLAGRDRRDSLARIIAGYGSQPAAVEPAFRYLACMFLAKNRELEASAPGTRRAFVEELTAVVASFT